jgi:hypothetical protein
MQVREINKVQKKSMPIEQKDELIKKNRARDDKLCKGMFEFIDAQGGWLEFSYRFYPGESIKIIHLTHGEICELPMGIVKHLNNTKKKIRRYDQNSMVTGDARVKPPRVVETISRVRFTPMDVL